MQSVGGQAFFDAIGGNQRLEVRCMAMVVS